MSRFNFIDYNGSTDDEDDNEDFIYTVRRTKEAMRYFSSEKYDIPTCKKCNKIKDIKTIGLFTVDYFCSSCEKVQYNSTSGVNDNNNN